MPWRLPPVMRAPRIRPAAEAGVWLATTNRATNPRTINLRISISSHYAEVAGNDLGPNPPDDPLSIWNTLLCGESKPTPYSSAEIAGQLKPRLAFGSSCQCLLSNLPDVGSVTAISTAEQIAHPPGMTH